jgi:hypothetical protein
VTAAPIAVTVHDGRSPIPEDRQPLIAQWLTMNRVNPEQVSASHPISVLTVPFRPPSDDEPWLIQVIVFHQHYVGPDGGRERNFLTHDAVCFQRTVPLNVPFPTEQPNEAPAAQEEAPRPDDQAQPNPERESGDTLAGAR